MRSLVRILGSARELWPYNVGIVACSVLLAGAGLLTPFIFKSATDRLVAATSGHHIQVSAMLWLAAALLAAELVTTVLSNIGGYLGDAMAARLRATLSGSYFAKLLSLPQRYFDNELTGAVINRLSRSIAETTNFLNMFANSFFQMVLTVVAVLAVTAFYSWPMALLLAVIYPVFLWLTTITSSKWQVLEAEKNREYDRAGGRFAEVVGQIRMVKSFVQERRELASFRERYDRTVRTTEKQSTYWHRMDVSRRAALNLIFFGIFAILFVQTARGVFTIGAMVLLIQLVTMARQPVFSMSFLVDSSQRAIVGSRDYFAVMDEPAEVTALPELARDHDHVRGQALGISLDAVSFRYPGGTGVLDQVSFSIQPGEHVAIVGESGGGKTTLIRLLLRLYAPTAGTIRIDNLDIAALPLEKLRANVGVVFQEATLFSGTVRENIAYARPNASDEEVIAAAMSSNAHEFVARFPDGYDAQIGEHGIKLSGGQRQRVAVARAILKDAPVLILDEATSALDSKSECLVQEGLDRLTADRTTLIIAHRLSTIAAVDRIITIKDGRVDEIGTPEELAATSGIYAELLSLQSSSTKRNRLRMQEFDINR